MRETREASFPDSRLWSPATRPTSAHGSLADGRDCTPEGPLVTQICHFGWPYTRGTLAVCSCISTGPEARAKSALGGTADRKWSYGQCERVNSSEDRGALARKGYTCAALEERRRLRKMMADARKTLKELS